MNILKTIDHNCQSCYKCIRVCPVKAIEFSNNQAQIIESDCVLCGDCYNACPQHAKIIRSDLSFVKSWLLSGYEVVVSLAPSFFSDFYKSNFSSMRNALLKLGVKEVFQTAEAAAFVKNAYELELEASKESVLITSACPSITDLIQKHYPEAIKYLSKVPSPMSYHGKWLREQYPHAKVVFIGPCLSKYKEQQVYKKYIDAVVNFRELKDWLNEEHIDYYVSEEDAFKGKTNVFPTVGGIISSLTKRKPDTHYISIDGIENAIDAIEDILNGVIDHCFIEMSACKGSCVGGPIRNRQKNTPIKSIININNHITNHDYDIDKFRHLRFEQDYFSKKILEEKPNLEQIEEVLEKMGKKDTRNQLNCGSCGYHSCMDKAIAVYQGRADFTMCLPFLKERAESFSKNIIDHAPNGILVLNKDLKIQLINPSGHHLLNITKEQRVLGMHIAQFIEHDYYQDIIDLETHKANRKFFLVDYQKHISEMTIYDKKFNVIIMIWRDITDKVNAKKQKDLLNQKMLETANDVIQKQMRTVQEIASLLGETTAETQAALIKLKESIEHE